MKIDAQTGSVTSAVMLKSTGQRILDSAALQAFRQWRFKPGTLTTLDIPIEFTRASPIGPRLKEAALSSARDENASDSMK